MKNKIAGFIILLVLILIFAFLAASLQPSLGRVSGKVNSLQQVDQMVAEQFPASKSLKLMQVALRYFGGNKQQNGVFICKDSLMLDVKPTDLKIANTNMQEMKRFVRKFECPSYLMLIPTASAIQQYKVPSYAEIYDQKAFIDEAYRRMSGLINSIDVYPTLFSHQDEYIYYRTDNAITGLGGYYVYTAASKKLGNLRVRGLEEFDVEHIDYDYYGDLYDRSPYRMINPDKVSAYVFSKYRRNYIVTHYDENGPRRYYTLYPDWKQKLGTTMDMLLGGMSPIIDISVTNSQQGSSLLIFGDRSVQSYLPFLLINYGRVTIVDTSSVTPQQLEDIFVEDYNQVLFAYSVDRFVLEDQLSIIKQLPINEPLD